MVLISNIATLALILFVTALLISDKITQKFYFVAIVAVVGVLLTLFSSTMWLLIICPSTWWGRITSFLISLIISIVAGLYFGKYAIKKKEEYIQKNKTANLNDILGKEGTVLYVEPDSMYIGVINDSSTTVYFTSQDQLKLGDKFIITHSDNVNIFGKKC